MNQPAFELPQSVLAGIQATMNRKAEEAKAMIGKTNSEQTISRPTNTIEIRTASDVTEAVTNAAEEVFDGFFSTDDRIDWHGFFDRLEQYGFSVDSVDSPAANKVKRIVRQLKSDS